jgi:hypothetical protein
MAVETPHFDLPFRLDPTVRVVEQDSLDDVANCVEAILRYRVGYRLSLLEFGIRDPAFRQGGPDLDEIAQAIEEFEDRAGAVIEDVSALQGVSSLEEAVSVIRVALEG